jgi:hypothetical protein
MTASERVTGGDNVGIVVRVRWFADTIRAAVDDGVRQVVLLGAGLDARPYRLPLDVDRFELDRPEVLADKDLTVLAGRRTVGGTWSWPTCPPTGRSRCRLRDSTPVSARCGRPSRAQRVRGGRGRRHRPGLGGHAAVSVLVRTDQRVTAVRQRTRPAAVWSGVDRDRTDQGEQGCLGLGATSVGKARAGRPAGVDARRVVRRLRVPEAAHGRLPAVVHRCGVDHGGEIVTLIYSMPVNDV